MAGVVDRAKSGAPRKVTGALDKRILQALEQLPWLGTFHKD